MGGDAEARGLGFRAAGGSGRRRRSLRWGTTERSPDSLGEEMVSSVLDMLSLGSFGHPRGGAEWAGANMSLEQLRDEF